MADLFDELTLRDEPQDPPPGQEPRPPQPPQPQGPSPIAPELEAWRQKYRRRLTTEKQQSENEFMTSFRLAVRNDPDFEAEALETAKKLGVDVEFARSSPDVAKEMLRERALLLNEMRDKQPRLFERLRRNYDFMRVAHGDLDALRETEGIIGWAGRNVGSGVMMTESGWIGLRRIFGYEEQDDLDRLFEIEHTRRADPGFLGSAAEIVGQMGSTALPALAISGSIAGTVSAFSGPGAAVTGPGTFAVATPITFGTIAGLVEAGNQYNQMRAQGFDHETARNYSLAYGGISGVLEGYAAKIAITPVKAIIGSGTKAVASRAMGKATASSAFRRFAWDYASVVAGEATTEVMQELAAIGIEEMARQNTMPEMAPASADQIASRLLEVAGKTAQGMALIGLPLPAVRYVVDTRRAARAQQGVKFAQALGENLDKSKVAEMAPTEMEAYLAETAKDGPVENVFIDGREFAEVLEQVAKSEANAGVTGDSISTQLEELVPGLHQKIKEAAANGGDVMIPLEQWAMRLRGTERLGDLLVPHLRFDPDDVSIAKIEEREKIAESMKAEAEAQVAELMSVGAEFAESMKRVEDTIYQQIKATKRERITDAQARAGAQWFSMLVAQQARRSGVLPEQWHDANPYSVIAGGDQQQADQLSQIDTSTPEFQARFGKSRIVDQAGKPLVVYHATQRGAGVSALRPGSHFGTLKAAHQRLNTLREFDSQIGRTVDESAQVFPVFLRMESPLRIPDLAAIDMQSFEPIQDAEESFAELDLEEQDRLRSVGEEPRPGSFESIDNNDLRMWLLHERIIDINEYEEIGGSQEKLFATLKEKGYDGFIYENAVEDAGEDSYQPFDADQVISSITGKELAQPEQSVQTRTPEFKAWFGDSKVVDEQGQPRVVYHGARRSDRIGDRFRKSRATSGPMAFFTDEPAVASSYANAKNDTSLEAPSDYSGWFKVKDGRTTVDIDRLWYRLSPEERQRVAERAPKVTQDDEGNLFFDEANDRGLGGYDQHIKEARGNHLRALVEEWLNSASLFNSEHEFLDVLKMAGLDRQVQLDDPQAERAGVFPVYLAISNPLDTSAIPENVVAALDKASKRRRGKRYGADPWDKGTRSGKEWMAVLRNDIANNESLAWTSIPDWVTKTLQQLGYDGIRDTGGKMGGTPHTVWIPFEESQVKSVTNRRPTTKPGLLRQLEPRELRFTSALEGAIGELPAKPMKAAQWEQQFKAWVNKGIVKEAEIEWSGIRDWIAVGFSQTTAQQNETATPEQALGYLSGNYTRVRTVDVRHESEMSGGGFDAEETIADIRNMRGDLREHVEMTGALEEPAQPSIGQSLAFGSRGTRSDTVAGPQLTYGRLNENFYVNVETVGVDGQTRARQIVVEPTEVSEMRGLFREGRVVPPFMNPITDFYEDPTIARQRTLFDPMRTTDEMRRGVDDNDPTNGFVTATVKFSDGREIEVHVPFVKNEVQVWRDGFVFGERETIDGQEFSRNELENVREALLGIGLQEEWENNPQVESDADGFDGYLNEAIRRIEQQDWQAAADSLDGAFDIAQSYHLDLFRLASLRDTMQGLYEDDVNGEGRGLQFESYTIRGGQNYNELTVNLTGKTVYTAPGAHSMGEMADQNRLLHIRTTDRISADGKKVLFIEEIQSDWAQAGRDRGFGDPEALAEEYNTLRDRAEEIDVEMAQLSAKRVALHKEVAAKIRAEEPHLSEGSITVRAESEVRSNAQYVEAVQREVALLGERNAAWNRMNDISDIRRSGFLPTNPFVEKTDAWVTLAIKQAVMHAIRHGYDKVAIINGAEQAKRYSYSNAVESIQVVPRNDGSGWRSVIFEHSRGTVTLQVDKDAKVVGVHPPNTTDAQAMLNKSLVEIGGRSLADQVMAVETSTAIDPAGLDIGGQGFKAFYDKIVPSVAAKVLKKLKGPKVASEKLYSAAYALAVEDNPETAPTIGEFNSFDITEEMRNSVLAANGIPLFQPTRGGFDVDTLTAILYQKADFSTFLHETGHFYVEALAQMASGDRMVSQTVREDIYALLDWWGIQGGLDEWNKMSLEEKRPFHEQFAYNLELYFAEGKAPSTALQRLFDRVMIWLKSIYTNIKQTLNAAYKAEFGEDLPIMTGEVRKVMDRMIASDSMIREALATREMSSIWQTQEESGMSDGQWAAQQQRLAMADALSINEIRAKSFETMGAATEGRSAMMRKVQARYRRERAKLRSQINIEVMADPVHRLHDWLKSGKLRNPDGSYVQQEVDADHKLNREAVRLSVQPEEFAKIEAMNVLRDDGISPDALYREFGFETGEQMLHELAAMRPLKEEVDARTDAKLAAEHPELTDPEIIAADIDRALHNEVRADFVAHELAHAAKIQAPPRLMMNAARTAARRALSARKVREVRPDLASHAEARATREANEAMMAGDEAAKIQSLRNRMMQHALTIEGYEVKDEIEDAKQRFKKLRRAPTKRLSKSRDIDMIHVARAILTTYKLDTFEQTPSELLATLREYNPDLATEFEEALLSAEANAKDYRDMTVEEFRVMTSTVDSLWHQSYRSRQVNLDGKRQALAQVMSELIVPLERIGVPAEGELPGETAAPTYRQKLLRMAKEWRAKARRMQHWSESVDGGIEKGADAGPWVRYIWRPIRQAIAAYKKERNIYVRRYLNLLKGVPMERGEIAAPELGRGYVFGRGNGGNGMAELLHALLHSGNLSNLNKLLAAVDRPWTILTKDGKPTLDENGNADTTQWKAFINRLVQQGRLTKAHFEFVQGVWDLLEELKPLSQRAHMEIHGSRWQEVDAVPLVVVFPDGSTETYRGGYVPAKTDEFLVPKQKARDDLAALDHNFKDVMPIVGSTITRKEGYRHALKLDITRIVSHIDEVVRYVHVHPVAHDVLRILNNPEIANRINRIDPTAMDEMILPWLQRSVRQLTSERGLDRGLDKFWNTVRSRSGLSTLMWSLSNALQQFVGVFPLIQKVPISQLWAAFTDTWSEGWRNAANNIADTSKVMNDRFRDQTFDLNESIQEIAISPSNFQKVQKWSQRHGYDLQSAFQNVVDIVGWKAAYNHYVSEHSGDSKAVHEAAVKHADDVILATQYGKPTPEDASRYEVGTPFMKVLTQFQGYFNLMANLNVTEFNKIVRELGWRGGSPQLFMTYVLTFAAPMLLAEAIVRGLGGDFNDDDDNGSWNEMLDWFLMGQIRGAVALLPFGSTLAVPINAWNNKPYDDRMMTSPSISALEAATVGLARAATNLASNGELTGKNVRDVLTLISLLTGIPVSAVGRQVGYVIDVNRGAVEPRGIPGFISGRGQR